MKSLLTSINSLNSKRFRSASNQQVYDFANSGLFTRASEIDYGDVYEKWEKADQFWRQGEYRKSIEIRELCMEEIYSYEGLSDSDYSPPIMSTSWTSAFGHIGSLGVMNAAQKLGVVSSNKRVALVKSRNTARNLERIFADSFSLTPVRNAHAALEHPSLWHVSERLQMVRSKNRFICLYELHDAVFKDPNHQKALPKLNQVYLDSTRELLSKVGIPQDAWFVAFHVRDNYGLSDTRKVDSKNFDAAIDEIIRVGGIVIQFGINSSQRVRPRKGLINLEEVVENHFDYHLYLLSQSKFVLTTNSGPSVIAWSLGTPVLQTNTTSIARNMLRASKGSLFLPKHYHQVNNRQLSYREIVSGKLGYSEGTTKDLANSGIRISENTSSEILDATREMLLRIDDSDISNEYIDRLNKIRLETSAIGFGEVANSFLETHSNWFLD